MAAAVAHWLDGRKIARNDVKDSEFPGVTFGARFRGNNLRIAARPEVTLKEVLRGQLDAQMGSEGTSRRQGVLADIALATIHTQAGQSDATALLSAPLLASTSPTPTCRTGLPPTTAPTTPAWSKSAPIRSSQPLPLPPKHRFHITLPTPTHRWPRAAPCGPWCPLGGCVEDWSRRRVSWWRCGRQFCRRQGPRRSWSTFDSGSSRSSRTRLPRTDPGGLAVDA